MYLSIYICIYLYLLQLAFLFSFNILIDHLIVFSYWQHFLDIKVIINMQLFIYSHCIWLVPQLMVHSFDIYNLSVIYKSVLEYAIMIYRYVHLQRNAHGNKPVSFVPPSFLGWLDLKMQHPSNARTSHVLAIPLGLGWGWIPLLLQGIGETQSFRSPGHLYSLRLH